jgi:hypothetical protein
MAGNSARKSLIIRSRHDLHTLVSRKIRRGSDGVVDLYTITPVSIYFCLPRS